MFIKFWKDVLLVLRVAIFAGFYAPQYATSATNPVVGKWAFAAFSFDSRSIRINAPATWNKGTLTLNPDFSLTVTGFQSSGQNAPGSLTGTYTITRDGFFNATMKDTNHQGAPVVLAGHLDIENDMIVSTLTINPQQPAFVSMIRQAALDLNAFSGAWSGQELVYNSHQGLHWASLTMMIEGPEVVLAFFDGVSQQTKTLTGSVSMGTQPGQVILNFPNDGNAIIGTVQISASGQMGSFVFEDLTTIGMGNLIKTIAPIPLVHV